MTEIIMGESRFRADARKEQRWYIVQATNLYQNWKTRN